MKGEYILVLCVIAYLIMSKKKGKEDEDKPTVYNIKNINKAPLIATTGRTVNSGDKTINKAPLVNYTAR